jgi:hypothetical protein
MAQMLVVLELLTGLYFLTGVLAKIINSKSGTSNEEKASK